MDILEHNRNAWNLEVEQGNPWTIPVTSEQIAAARNGDWSLVLTPVKKVPKDWYPELKGSNVLCLASGGGQQGPILAAAGARVTVFDNCPSQLDRDRMVSKRDRLDIRCVQGDMADLSAFKDESFDFIVHPVSNCFAADVLPVWKEAFRVLRHGGSLIAGMAYPITFLFDEDQRRKGVLQLRHQQPYSDLTSISEEDRIRWFGKDSPVEFSHTLETQLGGQLAAGFHLIGFYEDYWGARNSEEPMDNHCPSFFATRALKP